MRDCRANILTEGVGESSETGSKKYKAPERLTIRQEHALGMLGRVSRPHQIATGTVAPTVSSTIVGAAVPAAIGLLEKRVDWVRRSRNPTYTTLRPLRLGEKSA